MFRRGFKKWCEDFALDARELMGLKNYDPINPWALAAHLDIIVWFPKNVPGITDEQLQLLQRSGKQSWSAATINSGDKHLIIVNSEHSTTRQSSDLAHELSHILLHHDPGKLAVADDGTLLLNTFNKDLEDEAAWLAGCLLLPRAALTYIKFRRYNSGTIIGKYHVSEKMLTWRLNVTGVNRQYRSSR